MSKADEIAIFGKAAEDDALVQGFIERIRAQARADEREQCCRDICDDCRAGYPVRLNARGQWVHQDRLWGCEAARIRERYCQSQQEGKSDGGGGRNQTHHLRGGIRISTDARCGLDEVVVPARLFDVFHLERMSDDGVYIGVGDVRINLWARRGRLYASVTVERSSESLEIGAFTNLRDKLRFQCPSVIDEREGKSDG